MTMLALCSVGVINGEFCVNTKAELGGLQRGKLEDCSTWLWGVPGSKRKAIVGVGLAGEYKELKEGSMGWQHLGGETS